MYHDMILQFDKVNKWPCAEIGLKGTVNCENKTFYSATYELKNKRTKIKLNVVPLYNNPFRYFGADYNIYKMTSTEFIFGHEQARVYFRIAD